MKKLSLLENKLKFVGLPLIIILLIFSLYNSLTIGLSWDENFHLINGQLRWEYLKSLGKFKNYYYLNNNLYPGLYDTLTYIFLKLLTNIFSNQYIVEIKHTINFIFSTLSIVGFFLLIKKIFNEDIAIFACILCLLNPFFFGHMGMNPKDMPIFFSFIWFCYFFLKYLENYEKKRIIYLLIFSFFIGFGAGIRISFLLIIFPPIVFGLTILIRKFKKELYNLIKKLVIDINISFLIIVFLIILCWPHVIDGGITFLFETIKNTMSWSNVPAHNLINGNFYETANTSRLYFLFFFIYRLPFFISFLVILSLILIAVKKYFFIDLIKNFKDKFYILLIFILFPISIAIIFKVNIYDNIRLFLFILPLISLLGSISLYYLVYNLTHTNSRILTTILIIFFLPFLYRFILITPYHYSYINYSYPSLKNSYNKFEHDYWGTSYDELLKNIKKKYINIDFSKTKISICGGNRISHTYYINKYFGIKNFTSPKKADYIMMTNRASFNVNNKSTCFNQFKGEDLAKVSRLGLTYSIFRKISKN